MRRRNLIFGLLAVAAMSSARAAVTRWPDVNIEKAHKGVDLPTLPLRKKTA
jgi:hypothetical protein